MTESLCDRPRVSTCFGVVTLVTAVSKYLANMKATLRSFKASEISPISFSLLKPLAITRSILWKIYITSL